VVEAGDVLENGVTGERLVFVRVGGEVLEMEHFWPVGHQTGEHFHPGMEERWLVVAGTAGFRIGGEERVARAGDWLVAPAGVAHSSWNAGDEPVEVRIQMWPGLRWAEFVERLFELGTESPDGRPDRQGLASLIRRFPHEIEI
jgi:quercetin dioxygenase-like cupin family protein